MMELNRAIINKNIDQAKELIKSLHWATQKGYSTIIEILLKNGANVNARDKFKQTPLHLAILHGHSTIVEILLQNGANVNAKDRFKQTPLLLATQKGHSTIIEILLKNGAK